MRLEGQLAKIAEVHNLTSLAINLYRRPDGTCWIGPILTMRSKASGR